MAAVSQTDLQNRLLIGNGIALLFHIDFHACGKYGTIVRLTLIL